MFISFQCRFNVVSISLQYSVHLLDVQSAEKPIHFLNTVHLVREPLDHITTLSNCMCSHTGNETQMRHWDDFSYKWAEHWVGNLGHGRVARAANYWLKWNQLARAKAAETMRIEDLDETKLIIALGVQSKAKVPLARFSEQAKVDATPEEKKGAKLTWAKLEEKVGKELAEKIKKEAEAYGYKY